MRPRQSLRLAAKPLRIGTIKIVHILIAHNDYGQFSGEEAAVENAESALIGHGHKVTWFRRSSLGVNYPFIKKTQAFCSGVYSFKACRQIEQLLSVNSFDVAQVQNLYPFLSASILPVLRQCQVPIVMRCPNYRLFCPTGLHLRDGLVCESCFGIMREWHCVAHNCEADVFKSLGYAVRNAFGRMSGMIRNNVNVFVVLSEFQRQRFIAGGIPPEQIEILPNPADIKDYQVTESDAKFVAFVGRVSEEKGIREFLAAARQLPALSFRVAGRIDSSLDIKEGVPENVEFVGFLSGQALDDFYAKSRLLVFPSKWFEGFPNTISKAMAHAKPVIATYLGAVPEIVDDGITGLLAKPGDAGDLTDKIEYLWERPKLCLEMGRAGWEKAQNEYSQQRFYERLIEIYAKAQTMNAARVR